MKSNKWYDDNKNTILSMYYDNENIYDICDKLSCNKSMIYRKFNEWNVDRREKIKRQTRYNALYDIDYKYFDDIDCEHKAYWVGFLLADGFVNEKEVAIGLQISDLKQLKTLKKI